MPWWDSLSGTFLFRYLNYTRGLSESWRNTMDSANIARLAVTEELQKIEEVSTTHLWSLFSGIQGYRKGKRKLLVTSGRLLTISAQDSDKWKRNRVLHPHEGGNVALYYIAGPQEFTSSFTCTVFPNWRDPIFLWVCCSPSMKFHKEKGISFHCVPNMPDRSSRSSHMSRQFYPEEFTVPDTRIVKNSHLFTVINSSPYIAFLNSTLLKQLIWLLGNSSLKQLQQLDITVLLSTLQ